MRNATARRQTLSEIRMEIENLNFEMTCEGYHVQRLDVDLKWWGDASRLRPAARRSRSDSAGGKMPGAVMASDKRPFAELCRLQGQLQLFEPRNRRVTSYLFWCSFSTRYWPHWHRTRRQMMCVLNWPLGEIPGNSPSRIFETIFRCVDPHFRHRLFSTSHTTVGEFLLPLGRPGPF